MSQPVHLAIHLLDFDADFQTRWLAASVATNPLTANPATDPAAASSFHTVGRRGDFRDFWAAARWLRRDAPPGPVHAWGRASLLAAALAGNRPIIHTPSEIRRSTPRWLHWLAARRDLTVICATDPLRTRLCTAGLAPDKCIVIPPGVPAEPSAPDPAIREELRRQLRLAPTDFVVLVPGESTRAASHDFSLWAGAIAYELDKSWKLLAWGRGPLANQLRRLALRMNHTGLFRTAPDLPFQDLLNIADAAILTAGPSAPALPLALCMAHGLPLVATQNRHPALTPQNALLVSEPSPRLLSQALLKIRHDENLRQSLAQTASADARRLFAQDQFIQSHHQVYQRLATWGE